MADTYEWEANNPLINHYSGDNTQGTTLPGGRGMYSSGSTLPWTPPDSSYQRNQSGNGTMGADGSGWQENKDLGGWTRFNPENNNQAFEYDDYGNQIRTTDVKRSTDLSDLWKGLGTIGAVGLGGYGLMNGFGGAGSLFGGEGAAALGSEALPAFATENAASGLSALTPTSVGSFGPVASVTAGSGAASAGGLGSLFSGNGLSGIGDFLKNPLFSGAPAGLTGMAGIRSLYDLYAKNQMAGEQKSRYDQIQNQINGGYSPGSPEFEYIKQELARKDAKAGRNSQYGPRAVELQARVADIKNRTLASMQTGQNNLQTSYLGNQYGGLNSLFNILGDSDGSSKITQELRKLMGK